jgi:integrase
MAIRTRRNKSGSIRYVADTYDGRGGRDVTSHETRREAADAQAARRLAARAAGKPQDRNVRFGALADTFLDVGVKVANLRPKTVRNYRDIVETHLRPAFGNTKVRDLSRDMVSDLFIKMITTESHARTTVNNFLTCLSGILRGAVGAKRVLSVHPLVGLAKELKLGERLKGLPKAMRPEQLATFLSALLSWRLDRDGRVGRRTRFSPEHVADPAHDVAVFAVMGWAGLRIGEALHLRPEDVDLSANVLRVQTWEGEDDDQQWTPKTAAGERAVDMAANLRAVVEPLVRKRRGARWLLYPELGDDTRAERQTVENHVRNVMELVLEFAGLPGHFTPHSLRHTFAMALLGAAVSIQYVSQQLGHKTIVVTLQTYGSSWPIRAPGAVDAMAAGSTPAGLLDALTAITTGQTAALDALAAVRRTSDTVDASTSASADVDAPSDTTALLAGSVAANGDNDGNNPVVDGGVA